VTLSNHDNHRVGCHSSHLLVCGIRSHVGVDHVFAVVVDSSFHGDHNDEGVVRNHEGGRVVGRSLGSHENVVGVGVGNYLDDPHSRQDFFYQVVSSGAFLLN